MSTPEFPVPYFQRIMRNPPAVENITINISAMLEPVNEGTVVRTKNVLAGSAGRFKIIDYVENKMKLESYITCVASAQEQFHIYSDGLIHYFILLMKKIAEF